MPLSRGILDSELTISYDNLKITFAGLEPTAKYFFEQAKKCETKQISEPRNHIVLFINVYPDLLIRMKRQFPHSTTACLLVEPSVTWPWNGRRDLLKSFDFVLTSAPSAENRNFYCPWYLGQIEASEPISYAAWLRRSDVPCLLAANKVSLVSGEMYSLRREFLHCGESVELAGEGWSASFASRLTKVIGEMIINLVSGTPIQFRGLKLYFRPLPLSVNYSGRVSSKNSFSARHKYAIVVENSLELVTEKVYDAILSGNVPIYVGPRSARNEFSNGLVFFAEPSLSSIRGALANARSFDHRQWLALRQEMLPKLAQKHSMGSLLYHIYNLRAG